MRRHRGAFGSLLLIMGTSARWAAKFRSNTACSFWTASTPSTTPAFVFCAYSFFVGDQRTMFWKKPVGAIMGAADLFNLTAVFGHDELVRFFQKRWMHFPFNPGPE